MKSAILKIIAFVKNNPEKIISCLFIITFIFVGLYVSINWTKGTASFSLEDLNRENGQGNESSDASIDSVDIKGLLVKKPLTYYDDLVKRKPFSFLSQAPKDPDPDSDPDPGREFEPETSFICKGIINLPEEPEAFIERGRKTYIVKEGDEIEEMKVTKIDVEKGEVRLWDKNKEKEIILPLGDRNSSGE